MKLFSRTSCVDQLHSAVFLASDILWQQDLIWHSALSAFSRPWQPLIIRVVLFTIFWMVVRSFPSHKFLTIIFVGSSLSGAICYSLIELELRGYSEVYFKSSKQSQQFLIYFVHHFLSVYRLKVSPSIFQNKCCKSSKHICIIKLDKSTLHLSKQTGTFA